MAVWFLRCFSFPSGSSCFFLTHVELAGAPGSRSGSGLMRFWTQYLRQQQQDPPPWPGVKSRQQYFLCSDPSWVNIIRGAAVCCSALWESWRFFMLTRALTSDMLPSVWWAEEEKWGFLGKWVFSQSTHQTGAASCWGPSHPSHRKHWPPRCFRCAGMQLGPPPMLLQHLELYSPPILLSHAATPLWCHHPALLLTDDEQGARERMQEDSQELMSSSWAEDQDKKPQRGMAGLRRNPRNEEDSGTGTLSRNKDTEKN